MKTEPRLIPIHAGRQYWVEWAGGAVRAEAIAVTPDGRVPMRMSRRNALYSSCTWIFRHEEVIAEIMEAESNPRPVWWPPHLVLKRFFQK